MDATRVLFQDRGPNILVATETSVGIWAEVTETLRRTCHEPGLPSVPGKPEPILPGW